VVEDGEDEFMDAVGSCGEGEELEGWEVGED
jgi:hypothetical protein